MKPLISVIVPIFNVEDYLIKCIDSILEQTYSNLEIILVDDGSPDNCGLICDKYKEVDDRIKVIHKKNGGLSDARNAGLDIASGDFIMFIDSDDYVSKNIIEKLYNDIIETNADISICDFVKYNDNSMLYNEYSKKKFVVEGDKKFDNVCNEYAIVTVVQWNKLFKKNIFDELRFRKGKINEDEFIICDQLNKAKRVSYNLEPLYYYLQRDNSIMSKFKIQRYDVIQALDERISFFENKNMLDNVVKTKLQKFNTLLPFKIEMIFTKNYFENLDLIRKYDKDMIKIIDELKKEKIPPKIKLKMSIYKKSKTIFPLILKFKCNLKFWLKNMIHAILVFIKDSIFIIKMILESLSLKDKIFIFGVPIHGNIGDQAILYAEKKFIKDNFKNKKIIEVQSIYTCKTPNLLKRIVKNNTIIYTGGGFLGSLWKNEEDMFRNTLTLFPNNKIIAFPQTFYFSNDIYGSILLQESKRIYESHDNLFLICREKFSFDFMKKNFNNCKIELCPDMVLYLEPKDYVKRHNNALFCIRKDLEKVDYDFNEIEKAILNSKINNIRYTDTVINKMIFKFNRKKIILEKIKEFSQYNLIVTDRLHGMIFAYLSMTPCIVLENKSYKVKGVYQWIKECNFIFLSNESNICEQINKISDIDKKTYIDLSKKYKILKQIIEE